MRLRLAAYLASDALASDAQASEDWRKKYDYVRDFHEGFARVELNDKWGFVNTEGVEVVKVKYHEVDDFSEGFAGVKLDGKWGFVNTEGKEVVKVKYDWVYYFHDGFAIVELNGKEGFVNTKGEEVLPPGKYKEKDLKIIETYLKLGGNLNVILPNFKPIA